MEDEKKVLELMHEIFSLGVELSRAGVADVFVDYFGNVDTIQCAVNPANRDYSDYRLKDVYRKSVGRYEPEGRVQCLEEILTVLRGFLETPPCEPLENK